MTLKKGHGRQKPKLKPVPTVEPKNGRELQIPSLPKHELTLRPSDAPTLIRDDQKKVVAGIKLESLVTSKSGITIRGWLFGFSGMSLLCDKDQVPSEIRRTSRADVLQAFAVETEQDLGFEMSAPYLGRASYSLYCHPEKGGAEVPSEFLLDVQAPPELPLVEQDISEGALSPLREKQIIAGQEIEAVIKVNDGIVVLGWRDDRNEPEPAIYISKGKGKIQRYAFQGDTSGAAIRRLYRKNVCEYLEVPKGQYPKLGFVAWLPFDAEGLASLTLGFDKTLRNAKPIRITSLGNGVTGLEGMLPACGYALLSLAEQFKDVRLIVWLEENGYGSQAPNATALGFIDHAFLVNERSLLLHGWIAASDPEIEVLTLLSPGAEHSLLQSIERVWRPDLGAVFPQLQGESLGFVCTVDDPRFLSMADKTLHIRAHGAGKTITVSPQPADLQTVLNLLSSVPNLIPPVSKLIQTSEAMQSIPGMVERLQHFRRANFLSRFSSLPTYVDEPNVIAAVDKAYALDKGGLVVYGWKFEPRERPLSITVLNADGDEVEVSDKFFFVYRQDVSENLRIRFPNCPERCGFICYADMPARSGDSKALCFKFRGNQEVWLKLAGTKPETNALELVKELLGSIPGPNRVRSELYDLFDRVLGKPIEYTFQNRLRPELKCEEKQFGEGPDAPEISVIVPLYGRFDFMRHQLAHFAGDPDFDKCDLIYVVDQPSIVVPTLASAAYCHELFGKPFRVLWYDANLGFAGANNMGSARARGDTLLLLNSDVLPQQSGWLTQLHAALHAHPERGAVGPLLEFGDGSIQHAGMQSRREPLYPGFLLNSHVGKGLKWAGGDEAREVPMLTAACVMLRKSDYLALGGLDEGYIIGDFEDSDLCLKLRKLGKRTWLTPAIRLWHLERQSQNLSNVAGVRELLTLFNGWRYCQKIMDGSIANPEGK